MKNLIIVFLFFIFSRSLFSLEYNKEEFEGCPENAFCKKETGHVRKKWLNNLKDFLANKMSEEKFNNITQNDFGHPISGWANEEASLSPNIIMWDSPCKQHQKLATKTYIADVFRKNLSLNDLKNRPSIFFSRAILLDEKNNPYSLIVPRGDAPIYMNADQLFYLKDEEGQFYGLWVSKNGNLKVTKAISIKNLPKESTCDKSQIELFLRSAPSSTFYQGYFCKEIWNNKTNNYQKILLGWSCN